MWVASKSRRSVRLNESSRDVGYTNIIRVGVGSQGTTVQESCLQHFQSVLTPSHEVSTSTYPNTTSHHCLLDYESPLSKHQLFQRGSIGTTLSCLCNISNPSGDAAPKLQLLHGGATVRSSFPLKQAAFDPSLISRAGLQLLSVSLYHPKLLSWYPVTPNQPLKYAFSAGADAHMIATFASTAVETQEPRASQDISYVGEGLSLV
jgi:hypothetical protein